jgi:uncharacterized membrane protein HdeD (DUF308 family)
MIFPDLHPVRNAFLKLAIHCASLLFFYSLFIGAISVWVGFNHRHQEGFWAPALAGVLFIALIAWLYFHLVFALKRARRRSDTLYL